MGMIDTRTTAAPATDRATTSPEALAMRVEDLSAWYGTRQAIADVSMGIEPSAVTAIIGPSGCGKSTLVRCLNRIHEVVPGARSAGKVLLGTEDIYAPGVDPVAVR